MRVISKMMPVALSSSRSPFASTGQAFQQLFAGGLLLPHLPGCRLPTCRLPASVSPSRNDPGHQAVEHCSFKLCCN